MIPPGDANHSALEETASLFQPDCLLPVQYFENFRRKVETEPEKRLMLAVLEDALACFQKHYSSRGGRGLRLFRETQEWIYGEDNGRPFSFTNICEVVAFDPQYVRQGLLRWREMKIGELSRMNFTQTNPNGNEKKPRIKILETPARRLESRSRMVGMRALKFPPRH
jgi:hypothetical protein